MADSLHPEEVARLTITADTRLLPQAMSLVRGLAREMGLDQARARQLEQAVDEAATNVIQHAFAPGERGSYTLSLRLRPGQVVVAIEDRGMPFDLESFRRGDHTGLGFVLLKTFADELHLYNRGPQGKRLEIVKYLPPEAAGEMYQPEEDQAAEGEDAPEVFETRLLEPQESVALARCVYRAWRYHYPEDLLYFPDQIRRLIEEGRLVSAAAFNLAEEVVAHQALMPSPRRAPVAEVGLAVLDPRYRGQGLLTRLLELLADQAAGRGLEGLFYQAPAHRPEEQQGLVEAGFHETALLLGGLPPAKDASGDGPPPRRSAMVFHRRLHQDQPRDLYVPFHHQGMVRRILEEAGLERNLVPPGSRKQEPEKVSLLDVEMHGAQGRALITVSRYGRDLEDQVRAQLKDLCLRDMACIHLDLPLDHPAAQETCASLEMAGFFFAGLLPRRGGESDVLRLQYLNHVRLELEDLRPVSPLGEALVDYVASQYLRVE